MSETAIWSPSAERIARANVTAFAQFAAGRGGPRAGSAEPKSYQELHDWSVSHPEEFWPAVWDFCGILGESGVTGDPLSVLRSPEMSPPPPREVSRWFPDARLNFAENLLKHGDSHPAIIAWNEAGPRLTLSYEKLRTEVVALAIALRSAGVGIGDRVCGFLPNIPETVVAMLASAAVGATWSSCSPDFGTQGVMDRFGQIEPKVLFCVGEYTYAGKRIDLTGRIREIASRLPSLKHVVIGPYLSGESAGGVHGVGQPWSEFTGDQLVRAATRKFGELPHPAGTAEAPLTLDAAETLFPHLPFDHPLYVMYSSGTTGLPKCMVHGAGGTLLQHLKELVLHTDLKREDRIFYFTTCGWMMWNWLVSSLAVGATIVLYDGAPMSPQDDVLWRMAEEERITVFGTSAKYLALQEKSAVTPAASRDLSALRAILSTGSPLAGHSYDYVYESVKADVHLASISGGTDIISCFALGNPVAPVYRGEIQCRGLGMAVDVLDDSGNSLRGAPGELVCTKPFPSMPVSFWNDPDGAKYRAAYFETFPGVWRHGDWAELTQHDGVVIYGRSDATLNPGGVRIGTAEIYRQVEQMPEVIESVAVGQEMGEGNSGDVRIVLFVRLRDGILLDDDLRKRIASRLRENCSPIHVPKKIVQIADIPRTVSGKISEIAVRETIHGRPVRNTEALANPASLALYRDLPELRIAAI